jgi:Uma2 family endonuclease
MSDMALDFSDALDYEQRRFTVDEYHRLVDTGIIEADERVELLDGLLVRMSPIGMDHWKAHGRVARYLGDALRGRVFVVPGGSFPLGLRDEPQPDIALLPPKWPDCDDLPQPPNDMLAFVEISDSSLRKDTRLKAGLYGRARISDYLVVDINANVVIHHSGPNDLGYAMIRRLAPGDRFRLTSIADIELDAQGLLAPTRKT